jgi:hypothetical protein
MSKEIKFISERVSYSKSPEETTVIITGRIDRLKETLLLTWLLAWTFCGIFIFIQLFMEYTREEKLYFIIFISFWLFFEYKILKVYRWRRWGKEYLRLTPEKLTIKKSVTDYAKAEEYFIENIKNWQLVTKSPTSFFQQMEKSFWMIGDDCIQFDYQGKTIYFGMQLIEKETNSILKLLTNS